MPEISLAGAINCKLRFYLMQGTGYNDILYVEVSTNGGGIWTEVTNFFKTGAAWWDITVNLSDYSGKVVYLFFFGYS